jgi:hypothetical protein
MRRDSTCPFPKRVATRCGGRFRNFLNGLQNGSWPVLQRWNAIALARFQNEQVIVLEAVLKVLKRVLKRVDLCFENGPQNGRGTVWGAMKRKWSWPFRKKAGHCISGRIGILFKTASRTGRRPNGKRVPKSGEAVWENGSRPVLEAVLKSLYSMAKTASKTDRDPFSQTASDPFSVPVFSLINGMKWRCSVPRISFPDLNNQDFHWSSLRALYLTDQ